MLKRLVRSFIRERHWLWLRVALVAALVLIVVFIRFPGRVERIASYNDCAQAGYPITDTNPPACEAPGHTYLGPRQPDTRPDPAQMVQTYELLVQGDNHGTYPTRQQIISDQAGWVAFWRQVHAAESPLPPLITQDFATHDVIALTEGPRPTAGYNLKVTAVLVGPQGSTIDVIEQIPTITCQVAQTSTNRYYLASTAKLIQPVNFKISTEYHHC